jgi:hypothetical protein
VDGGQHDEQSQLDRGRDAALGSRGFAVLRFWNSEVLQETDAVLERIGEVVRARAPSPPAPLPLARERGDRGAGEGSVTSAPESTSPACAHPPR